MKTEPDQLQIEGLTRADILELESTATVTEISKPPTGPPGAYPEPVTLAVIIALTPPVLTFLSVWLLQKTKASRKTIKFKRITKDGEQIILEIDERHFSKEAPKSDVIKAIGGALKVDPADIAKAVGNSGA
jgi:hypothetical protein